MSHFGVGNGHVQAVAQGVIGEMCPCHFVSSRMPSFGEDPTHIATVLTWQLLPLCRRCLEPAEQPPSR